MCGISRVFNNILTIAKDLIINLKSTGMPVDFGSNELVKQFIKVSIKFWNEDHHSRIPHKLRNDHLEDQCLTLYSALNILCWDIRY
jgi:hypothetical protein